MLDPADPGVMWLLGCSEPAVRRLVLTDVLGAPADYPRVGAARQGFADGSIVPQLLTESHRPRLRQMAGPFWRLSALVELGVPPGQPVATEYLGATLAWLRDLEQRGYPPRVAGLTRAHALWHGHALAAVVALEWNDTSDVSWLIDRLLAWQWPDGVGTATGTVPLRARLCMKASGRCGSRGSPSSDQSPGDRASGATRS